MLTLALAGTLAITSCSAAGTPDAAAPEQNAGATAAYERWLQWAAELGFDASGSVAPSTDATAEVARLDAADLAELTDAIAAGRADVDRRTQADDARSTNSAMALGSWLFAAASADRVTELHDLVPLLEPGAADGLAWERFDGALEGELSMDDLHQGAADDCWLLAGLGAVTYSDPDGLAARIRSNDNGTITVRLARDGGERSVTVSPYLPVREDGALAYAHAASATNANWSSFVEKAFAALPEFGSYARLAGGSLLAESSTSAAASIESVTGGAATTRPGHDVTIEDLRRARDEGRAVTATTFLTGLAPEPQPGEVTMVDRHVYVLESVDAETVTLRNPWGYATSVGGPEAVRLGIADVNRRILVVTFGPPATT